MSAERQVVDAWLRLPNRSQIGGLTTRAAAAGRFLRHRLHTLVTRVLTPGRETIENVPPGDMNFVVDRVGSESQQIAEHLFQLYAHDFSEFATLEDERFLVDDDGLFALPLIEKYWTQPKHSFYLIRANEKLAGFAAINDWSPSGRGTDHNVAEFFVMRHYRRNGAGTQLARRLFLAHPGLWELAIMASNKPAQAFWPTVIAGTPHSSFEKIEGDGIRWHGPIYRFEIGR